MSFKKSSANFNIYMYTTLPVDGTCTQTRYVQIAWIWSVLASPTSRPTRIISWRKDMKVLTSYCGFVNICFDIIFAHFIKLLSWSTQLRRSSFWQQCHILSSSKEIHCFSFTRYFLKSIFKKKLICRKMKFWHFLSFYFYNKNFHKRCYLSN